MKTKLFSYTAEQLTSMSNDVIDAYLSGLANNKVITTEQYGELMNYRIIVSNKWTFGQLWNRWFKKSEDEDLLTFTLVKTFEKKNADQK